MLETRTLNAHPAHLPRPSRVLGLFLGGGLLVAAVLIGLDAWWIPSERVLMGMPLPKLVTLAKRHPGSESIYFCLGRRLEAAERVYEAETAYEQAAVNDPRSSRALDAAARLLAAGQQFHDAALHFEWALRVEPDLPDTRRALAMLYTTTNDWERATTQFRWLVDHGQGDAETWYRLGMCLRNLGREKEAQEAVRQSARAGAGAGR